MPAFINLTGRKFHYLTALRIGDRKNNEIRWLCQCECGKETLVSSSSLREEETKSCGCKSIVLMVRHHITHGMTYTRIYRVWRAMVDRCEKPNHKLYPRWGGRGIKICEAWHAFENFHAWAVANGYHEGLTIERKDNNGNYEPDNCKWATQKEQANNRRTNVFIEFQNQRRTLTQWSEYLGIKKSVLRHKLKKLPIEQALGK